MDNWLDTLTAFTGNLSDLLWKNYLTLAVLLGVGVYLTLRMRFIQIRGFRHSLALVSGRYSSHKDVGEVSHFRPCPRRCPPRWARATSRVWPQLSGTDLFESHFPKSSTHPVRSELPNICESGNQNHFIPVSHMRSLIDPSSPLPSICAMTVRHPDQRV